MSSLQHVLRFSDVVFSEVGPHQIFSCHGLRSWRIRLVSPPTRGTSCPLTASSTTSRTVQRARPCCGSLQATETRLGHSLAVCGALLIKQFQFQHRCLDQWLYFEILSLSTNLIECLPGSRRCGNRKLLISSLDGLLSTDTAEISAPGNGTRLTTPTTRETFVVARLLAMLAA